MRSVRVFKELGPRHIIYIGPRYTVQIYSESYTFIYIVEDIPFFNLIEPCTVCMAKGDI